MSDDLIDSWVSRMLHPPLRPPRPLPAALAAVAQDVTIPAAAIPLKAWLVPAAGGSSGIVAFIHGWGGDAVGMAPMALRVAERGFDALLVDLPGHGRTGGVERYDAGMMVRDIASVRDWIDATAGAEAKVALVGYSFGGLGGYVAAGRDSRWRALVTIAAPMGAMAAARLYLAGMGMPARMLDDSLRRSFVRMLGTDPHDFDVEGASATIRIPVLVVHGDDDEVVPVAHAEQIAAAMPPGTATLLRIPGTGHNGVLVSDETGERVAAFMVKYLTAGESR